MIYKLHTCSNRGILFPEKIQIENRHTRARRTYIKKSFVHNMVFYLKRWVYSTYTWMHNVTDTLH